MLFMAPSVHASHDYKLQGRHTQSFHGICISGIHHNNNVLHDDNDNDPSDSFY